LFVLYVCTFLPVKGASKVGGLMGSYPELVMACTKTEDGKHLTPLELHDLLIYIARHGSVYKWIIQIKSCTTTFSLIPYPFFLFLMAAKMQQVVSIVFSVSSGQSLSA
jgi:hypothetical protein